MAIDTGSTPGEQQSVFARSPDIPGNLGKIDVAAIYDAAVKGLSLPKDMADNTRAAIQGNQATATDVAKEQAARSLIPGQTQESAAETALGTQRAQFLGGLNPNLRESIIRTGQVPSKKTILSTYDPTTQSTKQTETQQFEGAGGSPEASGGSTTSSQYQPYTFTTSHIGTDENGNPAVIESTYRARDLGKEFYTQNADGTTDVVPDNALLIGSKATVIPNRVSPGPLALAYKNYQQVLADNGPDSHLTKAAEQGVVQAMGSAGLVKPPATAEGLQYIKSANDIQHDIDAARLRGDTVTADRLTQTQNRLVAAADAINVSRTKESGAPEAQMTDTRMKLHANLSQEFIRLASTTDDASKKDEYLAKAEQQLGEVKAIETGISAGGKATKTEAPPIIKGPVTDAGQLADGQTTISVGGQTHAVYKNDATGERAWFSADGKMHPLEAADYPAEEPAAPFSTKLEDPQLNVGTESE
jgi:hypothetical protein